MPKLDLVERLSDEPTSNELKIGLDAETTRIWHDLCLEARDEIERLRARISPSVYIDGLIAEIERQRKALKEIGKHKTYNEMDRQARENTDSMTGHDYFIEVARAAIKELESV